MKMSKMVSSSKNDFEDSVERSNPGTVYCETDPNNPRIWVNPESMRIIKSYIPISTSRLKTICRICLQISGKS